MSKITKIEADDIEIPVQNICKAKSIYIVANIDPMNGQYNEWPMVYSNRNEAMVAAQFGSRVYQLDLPEIKKEITDV